MRVTAGIYKGRTLNENKFSHIRPTADMVKQAIFNKMAFSIAGAKVLDLFCGTGALGLEALSRGAKEVVFVDVDSRSINLTKSNLIKLNILDNYRIIKASYDRALKMLKDYKFDIIILDPPYKAGLYEEAIRLIAENDVLAEDGIIVCEHDKSDTFNYFTYQVIDEKQYGIKKVTYLQIASD